MTLPSGNKVIKRAYRKAFDKIEITDADFIFTAGSVPDPLIVDNLTVNVLANLAEIDSPLASITDLDSATATIDDLTTTVFEILEPGGPSGITLAAPSLAASYTLTFPADDGTSGQVLTTDGTGILSWTTPTTSAPTDASYIVVALSAGLSAERRLQPESSVLTLTDGGPNADLTVGVAANGITDAKLRQSAACSVIGRSANSTGDVADISGGTNDRVLARQTNALSFVQVSTAMLATDSVDDTILRNSGACSVIGRSANSSGDPADISASANGQVLVRASNALSFTDDVHVQTLRLDDDDASASVTLQSPGTLSASYTLTFPADDGTANQLLATDGSGVLSWTSAPQVNSLVIVENNGSGNNTVTLKAADSFSADYTLKLPTTDGNSNEVLTTDGSGVLSWNTVPSLGLALMDWHGYRRAGTTPLETWYTNATQSATPTTTGLTRDRLYFSPFYVPRTMTLDRIAFPLSSVGGTGSHGRMGIYRDKGDGSLYPDALVVDGGQFDTSAGGGTGNKIATINTQLTAGLYWFAFIFGDAAGGSLTAFSSTTGNPQWGGVGAQTATLIAANPYQTRAYAPFTYAALSGADPFPGSPVYEVNAAAPLFIYRIASYP